MNFDDYIEITQTVYEFAFATDTRDYERLKSVVTKELALDYTDVNGSPVVTLPVDDWIAGFSTTFAGLDASQHILSNPVVQVNGDRASCRVYAHIQHFMENDEGEDIDELGGYYVQTLDKLDGKWTISGVTLKVFWVRGNRHLMKLGYKKGKEKLKITQHNGV